MKFGDTGDACDALLYFFAHIARKWKGVGGSVTSVTSVTDLLMAKPAVRRNPVAERDADSHPRVFRPLVPVSPSNRRDKAVTPQMTITKCLFSLRNFLTGGYMSTKCSLYDASTRFVPMPFPPLRTPGRLPYAGVLPCP